MLKILKHIDYNIKLCFTILIEFGSWHLVQCKLKSMTSHDICSICDTTILCCSSYMWDGQLVFITISLDHHLILQQASVLLFIHVGSTKCVTERNKPRFASILVPSHHEHALVSCPSHTKHFSIGKVSQNTDL